MSFIAFQQEIQAQTDKRIHMAQPLNEDQVMTIDGYLHEEVWNNSGNTWSGDFIQRLPKENEAPTQQTTFTVFYDNKYLYIGILAHDEAMDLINQRMSRRDGYNGDWIEVIIDGYHDLRSAASFSLSAAGVKSDKYISLNGAEEDIAWNPIWYANSALNENGWTAEMKIPLSQLRFGKAREQTWGLQVQRRILRKEELSVWQRVPLDAPGWVSEFGELHGLMNLRPQKHLEVQPFTVGSLNTFEKEPNNPYRNKNKLNLN